MQSETTLVWTEGRVELDSVTPVDGDGTVISLPSDSEGDDSLWDLDDLEGSSVFWLLLEELGRAVRSQLSRVRSFDSLAQG